MKMTEKNSYNNMKMYIKKKMKTENTKDMNMKKKMMYENDEDM